MRRRETTSGRSRILTQALRVGRAERIFGYRLANYNIPTFQLSADGRVVKFSGGVNHGGARALARLLAANPSIKVIHLNSPGGLYAQAMETAKVIKSRGLDTYVSDGCESACVELFLAGRERLIGPGARIGFHQASVRGSPSIDGIAMDEGRLSEIRHEPALRAKGAAKQNRMRCGIHRKPSFWRNALRHASSMRRCFHLLSISAQSQLKAVDLLYAFGERHFKEGRLDRAIAVFRRSDTTRPRSPARLDAARRCLFMRRETSTERSTTTIKPTGSILNLQLSSQTRACEIGQRRNDDAALQDLRRVIALSPNDAEVNYYRGLAHNGKMAHDLAIEYYQRCDQPCPGL